MEDPAEGSAVPRLRGAHVRAVRLDPAAERDIRAPESFDECGELIRRRRHVGVERKMTNVAARARGCPPRTAGALAAVGHCATASGGSARPPGARLRAGPGNVKVRGLDPCCRRRRRGNAKRGGRCARAVGALRRRLERGTSKQLVQLCRPDPLRLVVGLGRNQGLRLGEWLALGGAGIEGEVISGQSSRVTSALDHPIVPPVPIVHARPGVLLARTNSRIRDPDTWTGGGAAELGATSERHGPPNHVQRRPDRPISRGIQAGVGLARREGQPG